MLILHGEETEEGFKTLSQMLCHYFVFGYSTSDLRLHIRYAHGYFVSGGCFYTVVRKYSNFSREPYSRYRDYYRRSLQSGSEEHEESGGVIKRYIRRSKSQELRKLFNISRQYAWRLKKKGKGANKDG